MGKLHKRVIAKRFKVNVWYLHHVKNMGDPWDGLRFISVPPKEGRWSNKEMNLMVEEAKKHPNQLSKLKKNQIQSFEIEIELLGP